MFVAIKQLIVSIILEYNEIRDEQTDSFQKNLMGRVLQWKKPKKQQKFS